MRLRLVTAVFAVLLSVATVSVHGQEDIVPDTLLVLKNGAEVRGLFIGLKDGQYTVRLVDGRTMTYEAGDVDRIERLALASAPPPPLAARPSPVAAPFSCQTFISEKDPGKSYYTTIKDITVSKKWYGSTTEMYGELAKKARKVGADAVVNVRTWHAPSGFAWAAPHAGGMAVKWTDSGRDVQPSLEGRCY